VSVICQSGAKTRDRHLASSMTWSRTLFHE